MVPRFLFYITEPRSRLARALLGLSSAAASTGLRAMVIPLIGEDSFWGPYYLGVLAASLLGGALSAAITVAGSALLGTYFFVPPPFDLVPADLQAAVSVAAFLMASSCMAWIGVRFRHLAQTATHRSDALEREVHEREDKERALREETDAMVRLRAVGEACSRSRNAVDDCLHQVLRTAVWISGAQKGTIQVSDRPPSTLILAAHEGLPPRFVEFFRRVGPGEKSACGAAYGACERVVVEDVATSRIFAGQPSLDVLLDAGVRAVQATPLISSTGRVLGMISTHFDRPHRPTERDCHLLDLLARQTSDYLERIEGESQRKELLRIAERAREQAERGNRMRDEFLAMLGHELRNPLAAVRNGIAAASADAMHRDEALAIARRQTEQLGRLVDDLLDAAQVTHGLIRIHREPVLMQEVAEHAVEAMRPLCQARDQTLHVDVPSEAIYIDGSFTRLEQVFMNLLSNACKYTDTGGQVWLSMARVGSDAVVSVRDSGIGIAPEQLPRVFDLFEQGDTSPDRPRGGLGIGLAVARRIVQLHGGSLLASSEGPGKGTEFVVRLPTSEPPSGAHAAVASPQVVKPVRILLAEDNVDVATSLRMLLEARGHRVEVVSDGVKALDAVRTERPDLMLADIGLPGMDGYEVARRVRSDPSLADVALVAVTGYGTEEDRKAAFAAGFDHHFVKPIARGDLDRLIAGLSTRVLPGHLTLGDVCRLLGTEIVEMQRLVELAYRPGPSDDGSISYEAFMALLALRLSNARLQRLRVAERIVWTYELAQHHKLLKAILSTRFARGTLGKMVEMKLLGDQGLEDDDGTVEL